MGPVVFKSAEICLQKWVMLYSKNGASCLLKWDELSSKSGASCLGASFMWGELSWGELSLGRVVLIPREAGYQRSSADAKTKVGVQEDKHVLSQRL